MIALLLSATVRRCAHCLRKHRISSAHLTLTITPHHAVPQSVRRLHTAPIAQSNANTVSKSTGNKYRTHQCSHLTDSLINQQVTVSGFVQHNRMLNPDLYFGVLRDSTGTIQLVWSSDDSSDTSQQLRQQLQSLTNESSVSVTGTIRLRPDHQQRNDGTTGRVELLVQHVYIANIAAELPLKLNASFSAANDELRLQHRHLDLRRQPMQYLLQLRHTITTQIRQYLNSHQFVDIETPTLFKSTPEGADEFIVPSKQPGHFYALPQSPQQHKQLLIASGVERYYQIARCYRDEGGRQDRQPEFTQVDIECAWVTNDDVMQYVERMIQAVVVRTNIFVRSKQHSAGAWTELDTLKCDAVFTRMSYADAVSLYGSDKPDTRFDMQLIDITQVVNRFSNTMAKIITIKVFNAGHLSRVMTRKELDALHAAAKRVHSNGVTLIRVDGDTPSDWRCNAFKDVLLQPDIAAQIQILTKATAGDLLVVGVGNVHTVNKVLGQMRLHCAQLAQQHDLLLLSAKQLKFVWVTNFPAFEVDSVVHEQLADADSDHRFDMADIAVKASHHPFTTIHESQFAMLDGLLHESINSNGTRKKHITAAQLRQLLSLHSQSYDVTCNGVELGGGSIRIHNAQLQQRVLQLLGADVDTFKHMLSALSHGCPVHGGAAVGLDRLTAVLGAAMYDVLGWTQAGQQHHRGGALPIRDVIAFPKTTGGNDLMVGAPSVISPEVLKQYHVRVDEDSTASSAHRSHVSRSA